MRAKADIIVNTLRSFGVEVKIKDIFRGPAITRYRDPARSGRKGEENYGTCRRYRALPCRAGCKNCRSSGEIGYRNRDPERGKGHGLA